MERDYEKATIDQLHDWSRQYDKNAMFSLGNRFREGIDIPKNDEKTICWYERSANLGQENAAFNLGLIYGSGLGVDIDHNKSLGYYLYAASKNHAQAMFNIGEFYRERKDSVAFYWTEKSAKLGCKEAMSNLGLMYFSGVFVESIDLDFAFYWLEKSAGLKHVSAMYNLAILYKEKSFANKSDHQSFYFMKAAAENGHVVAMRNLGVMYAEGDGVKVDNSEAFRWIECSANKGDADSIFNLGVCFEKGVGVDCDLDKSVLRYVESGELGFIKGWYAIVELRNEGEYVDDSYYNLAIEKIISNNYSVFTSFESWCGSSLIDSDFLELFKVLLRVVIEYETEILNNNGDLYHYTSRGVCGIFLDSCNDGKNALRMYMTDYLNDPMEGKYVFDASFEKSNEIGELIRNLRGGFEFFMIDKELKVCDVYPQVYSLSFSKTQDNLDMWRAYGREVDKANGVSISIPSKTLGQYRTGMSSGLYKEAVSEFRYESNIVEENLEMEDFLLYDVQYGDEAVEKLWLKLKPSLMSFFEKVDSLECQDKKNKMREYVFYAISRLMYLHKHEAYKSEREVRALKMGALNEVALKKDERNPARLYFDSPKILFQDEGVEITLGPQMSQEERSAWIWIFRKQVVDAGLSDKITIKSSKVPFR